MKPLAGITMLLGTVAICLAWCGTGAAQERSGDGFVCVPTSVAECTADGECQRGNAQSENFPTSLKVDLKAKTIRTSDPGRHSGIDQIQRTDGTIILNGLENGRAWVMMIQDKSGNMSATIAGQGESFVVFGVCPG